MEVKVISREMIKPSKPTSPENKTFHLCSLDIFHRNTYFVVTLFYPTFKNPNNILKQSLSETLAIFYPLAGRRKDLFSVSCNDEGAVYCEATVNTSISDFLNPPKLESLNQLAPSEPAGEGGSLPHLLVQVNTFECGGVAIVVSILHTLMDANSLNVLVKTWSAICRNKRDEIAWPDYDSAFALFPPRDFSGVRAGIISTPKVETICTIRRFVFTEEAINKLRTKAKEEDEDEGASTMNPTRYQVLSSFMAKHMMLAYKNKGIRSLVLLMHIMDVRRRRGDPLNSNTMGNVLWPAIIPYDKLINSTEEDTNNNISVNELAKMTREKIGSFDKNFFLKVERDPNFLQSDECGEVLMEGIMVEKEKPVVFVFSSWGHLGFNEMDFGWGKPLWYGKRAGTGEMVPNSVIMIHTNQGIEAWIAMPQEYLALLEKDDQFLSYALLNPPVSC